MKKIMVLCCASVLCACAGMNKNTVSYQMSKYDQHAYYVVAGEGPTKEEASAAALVNMQKSFWQNVPQANTLPEVKDLMANAKVEKVWKDKSAKTTKHYFALALLPEFFHKTIVHSGKIDHITQTFRIYDPKMVTICFSQSQKHLCHAEIHKQ